MRRRVLVADDEEAIVEILTMRLEDEGFEVRAAADGNQAAAWLERERFDVVVLDVMMPGLTGWDVAERLRAHPRTAGVPFVFLTASDRPQDELRGLELGAFDFVVKPFTLDDAVRVIFAAAEGREPRASERQERLESLRRELR
jgi:DNA-binding response OmpR family regulator